jgi:hypothetical protein
VDDLRAFVECYEFMDHETTGPEPVGYEHEYQFNLVQQGEQYALDERDSNRTLSAVFSVDDYVSDILSFDVLPKSRPRTPTKLEKGKSRVLSDTEAEPSGDRAERLTETPRLLSVAALGRSRGCW